MSLSPRRWLGLGLLALILAAAPAPALADGDPASDVLLTENVFLPFSPQVSASLASALAQAIRRAHAAGYPIKVAVIGSKIDLGADPELFGTPERYARFLALEITYNATPPLLIVMPQGFGTAATVAPSTLSGVPIDAAGGSDGLARAAITAVVTLARRAGHPIAPPAVAGESAATGGGAPVGLIVGGAAVVCALLAGAAIGIRRRRAHRSVR